MQFLGKIRQLVHWRLPLGLAHPLWEILDPPLSQLCFDQPSWCCWLLQSQLSNWIRVLIVWANVLGYLGTAKVFIGDVILRGNTWSNVTTSVWIFSSTVNVLDFSLIVVSTSKHVFSVFLLLFRSCSGNCNESCQLSLFFQLSVLCIVLCQGRAVRTKKIQRKMHCSYGI